VRVIDDTYNANPLSVAAAIAVLAGIDGRTWLVLGDMAELGEHSAALHAEVGQQAKAAGIERLLTFGAQAQAAATAFGDGGHAYAERDAVAAVLGAAVDATGANDLTILLKGSRCMGMEKLLQAVVDDVANFGDSA